MKKLERFFLVLAPLFVTVFAPLMSAQAQGIKGHDELSSEMIKVLSDPDSVTVYSLGARDARKGEPSFYGWFILGKSSLVQQREKKEIGKLLAEEVEPFSVSLSHFRPHHGISFRSKMKKVDFVLSFDQKKNQILIYSPAGEFWNQGLLHDSRQIEAKLKYALRAQTPAKKVDSVFENQ